MNASEAWTIGRLLTWTTDFLKKHGSQSPRLDAEVLLAQARKCERIQLYTAFDEEPADDIKAAFREMVKRRADGTPVAYLVGHKEFYSAAFEVTRDVLIPRPETEHLIVEALDRAAELRKSRSPEIAATTEGGQAQPMSDLWVADVGTGSGIIAITIAKHLPAVQVVALDNSPAALEVAGRNAARHSLGQDKLRLHDSDLLGAVPAEQQFDLILSNPPYVSSAEYAGLEKTVRDFEPQQALVAGPEGYEVIVRLLEQAGGRLKPDGFLIIEFSPMLAERQSKFVSEDWEVVKVIRDLSNHARVITLRKTPK